MRADGGPPPVAVIVAGSLVGAVVSYLDLFGADLAEWGGSSLFSYGAVVAFLVPTIVVLRNRYRRWLAHQPWPRWPELVLVAAGVAAVCSGAARAIGEGGLLGLLACALGAAAIAHAGARLRTT